MWSEKAPVRPMLAVCLKISDIQSSECNQRAHRPLEIAIGYQMSRRSTSQHRISEPQIKLQPPGFIRSQQQGTAAPFAIRTTIFVAFEKSTSLK